MLTVPEAYGAEIGAAIREGIIACARELGLEHLQPEIRAGSSRLTSATQASPLHQPSLSAAEQD